MEITHEAFKGHGEIRHHILIVECLVVLAPRGIGAGDGGGVQGPLFDLINNFESFMEGK
jgi:hypothetical protein